MAGTVSATAYYSRELDGMEVLPDRCPLADVHRKAAEKAYAAEMKAGHPAVLRNEWTLLKCRWIDLHGQIHHCVYNYGFTEQKDHTRRLDLSMLRSRALAAATHQTNCLSLCFGQTRNRQPGY